MGFFIDESVEEVAPSNSSSQVGGGFFVDETPTVPQKEPLGFAGNIAGGFGNALEGLGLGRADEIIGGGAGALDYAENKLLSLFGRQDSGLSYSDYASNRMSQSEGLRQQFKEESPIAGYGAEIAGAVANPLNAIKLLKGAGLGSRLLNAGLTQGGIGAIYGSGDNVNPVEGAKQGFTLGATLGPAAELLGSGIGKAADKLGDWGSQFKLSSLGITKADLRKASKSIPNTVKGGQQQNPLVSAFKEFESSGGLKEGLDPDTLFTTAATQKATKDAAVKGIVAEADSIATPLSDTPITTNLKPDFSNTISWIKNKYKGTQQKAALQIFDDEVTALNETLDSGGTLSDWQSAKVSVQDSVDYSGTVIGKLGNKVRAKIGSDIRQHIEDSSDLLLGQGAGKAVKQLNKESGQRAELLKIFKREKDNALGGNPLNSLSSVVNQYRVPVLLAGIGGAGELGRSGDLGSALTVGAAAGLASTSSGKYKLGQLFGLGSKAVDSLSSIKNLPVGVLGGMFSGDSQAPQDSSPTFSLPTQGPTVMPKADDIDLDAIPKKKADRVAFIESQIDSDPVDAAIYEIESGRNPNAKNPTSSASGAFQLINKTAKKLGVSDVFDIAENYKGYLKLKEENQAVLRKLGVDENDAEALYSLHYLGAPTFKKLLQGKPLTEQQAAQVRYLEGKVLPKFNRVYKSKLTNV